MRSYRASKSKSTSTAISTSTSAATIVAASGDSQPELAIEQQQQGSFVGLSTTVHTPESTYIPILADDRDAGLRLLAEISASQPQIDPFQALATYQTVSLNDNAQEQSASSLSLFDEPVLSNEPSQAADDANPIMEVEEPNPERGQNLANQNADSMDKWIMNSGSKIRPFKCGYEDCGITYTRKYDLRRHFLTHIGDPQFRCFTGDCAGEIQYHGEKALARHIYTKHTMEKPYECGICNKRFARPDNLNRHKKQVHSVKDEQNQPQNSASTDKWIMYSNDKTRPLRCGYEGCSKTYITKQSLQRHFISHTGDSQFRCYTGNCTGANIYCDKQALARHIHKKHTMKRPFTCEICNNQFVRVDHLNYHQQRMHSTEKEQTTKKVQKSPPKRKRK